MGITCEACDDTGMIPCYLGGGYTGMALCYQCERHKETYTSKDHGSNMTLPRIGARVGIGGAVTRAKDFRAVVGREPMPYAEEWELAHLLQQQWFQERGQCRIIRHHQSYGARDLLDDLRSRYHKAYKT